MAKLHQTHFLVENEMGVCPGCGRTCVLRKHRWDEDRLLMCSTCHRHYSERLDELASDLRYVNGF